MRTENNINYYSSSELNTASQCLYRHHLKYKLHIKGTYSNTLQLGKTFHKIIELIMIDKRNNKVKEVIEYKRNFEERYKYAVQQAGLEWENERIEDTKKAFILIDKFFEDYLSTFEPLRMEYEVKAPISDSYGIYGFVDYIGKKDFFIDWKTTKRTPSKPKKSVLYQMKNYALSLNLNKFKLFYFVFKKQPIIKTFEYEFTDEQMETYKAQANNIMFLLNHTAENLFVPYPSGLLSDFACDYCNLRYTCPYVETNKELFKLKEKINKLIAIHKNIQVNLTETNEPTHQEFILPEQYQELLTTINEVSKNESLTHVIDNLRFITIPEQPFNNQGETK